jgi:hypothetical protein
MATLFITGELYTPYYIFLRCAGRYPDRDLLHAFGLGAYQPTTATVTRVGRYTILANDGQWTVIADDWRYTLWHMPSTRLAIAALAESCDVFACSVGDSDHSFDFAYYRESRLVRNYVVSDPDFRSRIVTENIGEPLPGESNAFEESDALAIVLGVAASLGIKTRYTEQECRVYAPIRVDE